MSQDVVTWKVHHFAFLNYQLNQINKSYNSTSNTSAIRCADLVAQFCSVNANFATGPGSNPAFSETTDFERRQMF